MRADPLAELNEELDEDEEGMTNLDFTLGDFDGHAIFGEAKANIRQGAESLLNEVDDQIDDVDEHLDYFVDNYIGVEPDHIDYVLATFASDANDITRAAISGGFEVVTWSVHQMEKKISVNTVLPNEEDIPAGEENDDVRLRIIHSNQRLN